MPNDNNSGDARNTPLRRPEPLPDGKIRTGMRPRKRDAEADAAKRQNARRGGPPRVGYFGGGSRNA